ncbi:hypothetical protein [Sulfurivirga caldicuralii]|uniref:hypothetical protein n=1 Tax=Sulfurivirga caldicuralii TaxID=364032 RepID=UPI0009407170|nr:hypothetical protein [Sulfurivirga caldicuralii]
MKMVGSEEVLSLVLPMVCQRSFEADAEYVDCIQHGVCRGVFERAGMQPLNFQRSEMIVPNYFEPFEQRNVPVYCVADPVPEGVLYRQFKADGDQDRPNLLEQI